MLRNLSIRNYALIEELDLEFGPGLTIITGETGAGKSIMLGALSLVMGARADTKVISDGNSKSVVVASFVDVDPELQNLLEERGIDWIINEDGLSELNVRREISASGRSKVFINDTAVTLQTLAVIVPRLIDIHSQHANIKINDAGERLRIIDSMAGNENIRLDYKKLFGRYVETRRQIKALKDEIAKSEENMDFMKFQLDQLDRLQPKTGELKEIENRFDILSDSDDIKEKLQSIMRLIGDYEGGVQNILAEAISTAEKIDFNLFSSSLEDSDETENREIVFRLKNLLIETKDIFETIEDYNSSIDSDPVLLSQLSERMNLYYELIKRFRVSDADELVSLHSNLKRQLSQLNGDDTRLPELEASARKLSVELRKKADVLSDLRIKSARDFSSLLCEKSKTLGLPNIRFTADIAKTKLTSAGQDEVNFLCAFNKNGVLRPIGDIASGGEISRMMLSLKSILAGHINLPTIIFDEVDTGVSGEIADKMGNMMHDVAENMQVIVITHLPQVAAKGDYHFKVFKKDESNRTVTQVKELDYAGRVRELASMISGSHVTDEALSAAQKLIKSN